MFNVFYLLNLILLGTRDFLFRKSILFAVLKKWDTNLSV